MVWLLIVVLLVVLATLWLFRKRWRRNKAIQILLYHSQRLTDQAMAEALQQLGISTDKPMTSKPIADIWGHGVMAFSYQISSSLGKVTQPALEQALRQAARQLDIASSDPALPPFVLTDFFELEGDRQIRSSRDMNDDQDLIMRQIKSFAQGLGAALGKNQRKSNQPVIVFHEAEVSLASYQKTLMTVIREKGLIAAQAQLKKWQQTRLSAHQYQRLNAWIQEQQLINRNPDK